jgi:predicted glycogen debranching enzyme
VIPAAGSRTLSLVTTSTELDILGLDPDTDRGRTEWLLTNGLGGYSMGTLAGVNRRRYHGLLIAAAAPPVERRVVVHSAIEQATLGTGSGATVFDLATQAFGENEALHPNGWHALVGTAVDPPDRVAWTWSLGGHASVERTLVLVPGENAIRLAYRVTAGDEPVSLRVRLLMPLRDFHHLDHEPNDAPLVAQRPDGSLRMMRDGIAAVMHADRGEVLLNPEWWRDHAYSVDRWRGQGWMEDVWSPGCVEFSVPAGSSETLVVSAALGEIPREYDVTPTPASARSDIERLELAGEQFIVRRGPEGTPTVVAGYPWFADWGRDALICLPGLCLATGRGDDAAGILSTFAAHLRHGLLPNHFDDRSGPPRYNSADAPLWFVHATWRLSRHDPSLVTDDHRAAVLEILDAYRCGTDHGIGVDDDGLVIADDGETPLTWMDARRDGVTFTPRRGKPVELSALWYHALRSVPDLFTDPAIIARAAAEAERTQQSFFDRFWWTEASCCHDVLERNGSDWSADDRLRPNQIFAVSLPHSPLAPAHQAMVVSTIERRLLTPYGLRTLDRSHHEYRGRFAGSISELDAAYHQGTVWPWLIGPVVEATLRVAGFTPASRAAARHLLEPLLSEMNSGCLGQIAEVYDGDDPHRPGGCPAQAWSVAEVLRAWTVAAR